MKGFKKSELENRILVKDGKLLCQKIRDYFIVSRDAFDTDEYIDFILDYGVEQAMTLDAVAILVKHSSHKYKYVVYSERFDMFFYEQEYPEKLVSMLLS